MTRRGFVVLHDHLDGGLRTQTVIDQSTIPLPAEGAAPLGQWFDQRESRSLERYLESFRFTLAAMTTVEHLERVAFEAVEDHAGVGVVHAEIRFGPLLLPLAPTEVIEAVLAGLRRGESVTGTTTGLILCALRQLPGSRLVADLAVRYREEGVVGFDLAGPEAGFPPDEHLDAIHTARDGGVHITLHAGEAAGVESIRNAVFNCGAERIGHGVEIIEDCRVVAGEVVDMGQVAEYVHDKRIPLELCPSSNLATKGWSPQDHPIGMLHRAGFVITLNTDNRLMSVTSMRREADLATEEMGLSAADLDSMTANAVAAAFVDSARRTDIRVRLDAIRGAGQGLTG